MFGHSCESPIALATPHPYDSLIAVCTSKFQLIILDLWKNRSLRQFSISATFSKEVSGYTKVPPIGLFFIDNVASRAIQSIVKTSFQTLPSDMSVALVFPKGVVTWDHTYTSCKWNGFDFTATCVAQAPDALVMSDSSGNLHLYSLINHQANKIAQFTAPPSNIFVTPSSGTAYGILAPTASGTLEFIASTGKAISPLQIDISRGFSYDPFTSTLYSLYDKRTAKIYSILRDKLQYSGECSFSGVSIGDSKPTNHTLLQISPCNFSYSQRPLFFALCDQGTLFVCSNERPLIKVPNFPGSHLKKINPSFMMTHPTELNQLIIVSEGNLLSVDVNAYLPQIVPSGPLPGFLKNMQQDGIYRTARGPHLTVVLDHTSGRYRAYDERGQKKTESEAFDIAIGPENRFATLVLPKDKKGGVVLRCFDEKLEKTEFPVKLNDTQPEAVRLLSFGDYFAVVVASTPIDLAANPQRQPKTNALAYAWKNFEPVGLTLGGVSMTSVYPPYVAVASPQSYAVYRKDGEQLVELVRRQHRVLHMRLDKDRLFVLTPEGLLVDDFAEVRLIAARFTHVIAVDRNASKLPINACYIKEVSPQRGITLTDNTGKDTTVGFPEVTQRPQEVPYLVELASAPDPTEAVRQRFPDAPPEEQRAMLLMMLRSVDWANIEQHLSPAEVAGAEVALESDSTVGRSAFSRMIQSELMLK